MEPGKSFFQDAAVSHQGQTYRFSAEEGQALESPLNYWHGPGSPSTWLAVAVFQAARGKVAPAPQEVALELAAGAMGITAEKLRGLIRWHEEYMRWHDGDPSYRVLEDEPNPPGPSDQCSAARRAADS